MTKFRSRGGRVATLLFGVALLAAGSREIAADQEPANKELPKVVTDNKNTLVKEYRKELQVTASTFWPGWAPEKVIDGNVETSWFTQRGDAAAKGTKPWITITFPEDVTVRRVTIV